MKNKIPNSWLFGVLGFILATLLMTVGFASTFWIVVVTVLASAGGYWLDKYDFDFTPLVRIFKRK
ncbi:MULTISPECIES: DUF2273 domain-containing protein [Leuconostoc]|uniref:DUF2273 domain-containing protein n=1 Tax=Leuconostoc pseudomesenteroides TaxID=33968 RepID=A0A5B8SYV7_LEUPS|nr:MULTISPECIES: DUF2273 domain-containing protein [Leuconostoc]MBK0041630.1 DUF2273 domain-containing protein [Leuconostoc sp. S51]MBK0052558.1 DUF2273 domain-containing protein [Leuconostoc sp. S50]MBS0958897.1 DUF2273 domain-containing protein [Leuconostoc pseudomesenteroides]MCT4380347.1 DUF2273 domain-containing protein [Leuconostoc pseudomesenteroides]QEA42382.1 DUF2273 domain-containing protein [Leuconostoc pseudomesenteroides]